MTADPQSFRGVAHKLGDVLQFRNEIVHPKDNPTGITTFVGLEHIERDTGIRTGSEIVDLGEMTGRRARFQAGDIVYGYLRPYLNKVWIAEFDGICSVDQYVFKVRPVADRDYVYHFLRSAEFLRTAPIDTAPGQLPRIRSGEITATPIPLPPLDEQKRIAAILDKADQLRQKRRQGIALLDSLTQSIFLEMFGDPANNPMGWPESKLVDCCLAADDIKCGPFGTQLYQSDFQATGVPLWGIKQVNKAFRLPTHEFLSQSKAEELRTYDILPGDLVMTRKGTVGNCAIYPDNFSPGIMHSDLLRVRLDNSVAAPGFMNAQLRYSRSVAHQLSLISGGAIMAGINVGKLKKITVLVPPIDQQRKFETALGSWLTTWSNYEMNLERQNLLFSSLQHRAFSGQL